jgi:hypothetical protein
MTTLGSEPHTWQSAALRVGEELAKDGPPGYYGMSPDQWRSWALHALAARDAENTSLRAQLAADAERLRAAERLVWGEVTFGCDGADHLADEILSLRAQLETQARESLVFVEGLAKAMNGKNEKDLGS